MSTDNTLSTTQLQPAGLLRRMGAIFYDFTLVIAVLFVATIPFFVVTGKVLVPSEIGWSLYCWYLLWQLAVIVGFFGLFWTRRGQTLGMQAWKLRVVDEQGQLLNWPLVLRRLCFATLPWVPSFVCFAIAEHYKSIHLKWLGTGLLLIGVAGLALYWADITRRTWHDRMARSRVVMQGSI